MLYPVLFRFTFFSHNLPKGTVSATLSILALSTIALCIEITRWVYFHAGGRMAFHSAALLAGIAVVISVAHRLKLRGQHQSQSVSPAGRNEEGAPWGTFSDNHTIGLCVGRFFDRQPAGVGNGTMVSLKARSIEHIRQLHALALCLGGADEGALDHRPHYGQGFHSAYVRDLDGNKLAFVFYDLVE